ncbi:hypothetical protein Zmor_006242 [Zophobas morio]|uniref:Uncharacterized protein n=1 Tax=Zophobas morio TaxID=2755281 RepID=A0AA38IUK0_9CUCU|nr:hypothetical protein Zmor_006242 [Zophobas morio]
MAKKSNTLSTDEIKKFIDTARDHKHLLTKVALIFGICEALQKAEMCNVKVRDLEDFKSALLFNFLYHVRHEKKSKLSCKKLMTENIYSRRLL